MLPSGRPVLVAATFGLLVVVGCAGARSVGPTGTGGGGGAGLDGGHDTRPRPDAHEAPPDPHRCGNGQADPGEDCDDGNAKGDDGCSLLCQVEPGWTCDVFGELCKPPVCGDGKLATSESCDDGNTQSGDGCSADCQTVEDGWRCRAAGKPCVPLCGDGKVLGGETCDDNNNDNGDGCSSNCLLEPGWDCSHLPCVKSVCGNGKVETGESCDEGDASMPGGKNGLFYGDGSGCSKTCTKEPKCRDDSPQHRNRACDAVCGNGNIDVGEECDDGDLENGDGCSDHCTLEAGFGCTEQPGTDSEACGSGTGRCLKLPIIYRDFKNETLVGGHPDFFFLGGRSVVAPTTGQLRSCVPNSGGLHRKVTSGDSTARCWGIAADDLNNGKPEYRSGATSATTYQCACQFSDWSLNNSGAHLGGLYNDAMSPITGLPNNGGVSGVNKSWSSVAAGLPGVPLVINGTTFGQWYKDDSGFSTRTQGVLELSDIGGNQFRFSSADDVITGGFFPLDASVAANSETTLCNLWPYWFNFAGCVGDQYLFPPSQGVTAPQGAWITPVTGHKHDFYFTTEVHYLFVFTPPLQLKFYGDDDLFIYINGKLVLDLGGIHQRLPGQVDVGADGNADVIEGGILNPTTGNIEFTYADPNNPTTTVTLTQPDDYRKRRVLLGLEPNRIYEIAVFHADRAPTESNYQLTLSGFATKRSVCEAHCGDGIRSGAEECDCGDGPDHPGQDPACDGPNDSSRYNGCTTDCKLGPFCGDEITNGDEECDIGRQNGVNLDRDTGCTVKCTFPGYCGDGKVNDDEKCDYGQNNGVIYADKPSCSTDCVIIIP